MLDSLDLNKSCEVPGSTRPPPAGVAVQYLLCSECGFCFAPELAAWKPEEFRERIYNDEYVQVDPDYVELRPKTNAASLVSLFGDHAHSIRHLDYGGGSGLMSELLRQSRWQSTSYDPFVDDTDTATLGRFDLITAFEVFEHAPDVQALMSKLRSLLAENGVILFSTLLSDGQIQPGKQLTWWYAAPRNGHISLHSSRSLGALAKQHGYTFGSFSAGFHVFCTKVRAWARPALRRARRSSA